MSENRERSLMRLLHGELAPQEAARVRRIIDAEPRVAARYAELERVWQELELPPAATAAPGLLADIRRRVGRERPEAELALWGLPTSWARAVAAAAITSGVGLGVLAGSVVTAPDEAGLEIEPSLAESYWSAIEVAQDDAALDDALGGEEL